MQTKAKPLRDDVPDIVLELIDEAAALAIPDSEDAIVAALERLTAAITADELAAAARGSAGPILTNGRAWEAFSDDLIEVFSGAGPMESTMISAASGTVELLPIADAPIDMARIATRANEWLDDNGSLLVRELSDSTKDGITAIVQQVFAEPEGTAEAAQRILDVKGFGLTRRHSEGLVKLAESMAEEGATKKQIEAAVKAERKRRLRVRANLIAATEARNAGSESQDILWGEAVDNGHLNPAIYGLEWVTRVIRVCPRCQALDGTTAPLNDGEFESRVVTEGTFAGQVITVRRPTVHPKCFCTRRVIRWDEALSAGELAQIQESRTS